MTPLALALADLDLDLAFGELAKLTKAERERLKLPPRESQINDPNTEH